MPENSRIESEQILERLRIAVARDQRIVAVLQGGSAVLGAVDEFSDLDLVIVCADNAQADVLAEAGSLAAELGPLLVSFTGEHVGEPRLVVCLYGPPLLHVDLKFIRLADLSERVEDGISVWRRDEIVEKALRPGDARWPDPDRQWIEDRFWVWVNYTTAKIGRGELFEALDALAQLRRFVLGPLIAARHGRRAQGVRRLEQYAPEAVRLQRTLGGHTREACTSALRATIEMYLDLRLDGAGDVAPRAAAEAACLAYLDEVAG